MDRLQEKNDLLYKLGMLLGPLQRLVDAAEQFDEQERAETIARYCKEYPQLTKTFERFSNGQPGCRYAIEFGKFKNALWLIENKLGLNHPLDLVLPEERQIAVASIQAIPVPRTSVVLVAGSPFTAYCKLRELCEADATTSLTWLDLTCPRDLDRAL